MRRSVGGVVACLAVAGVASCGSSDREAVPRSQPPVVPLLVDRLPQHQDAEDRDANLRRRSRAAVANRPALQELPWLDRHLAIDFDGVTSDGRVVLIVRSDRGRVFARRAYRSFLRRFDDDGTAYLPTFRSAR